MEDASTVACPNCSEALYKAGPIDFAASIFGRAIDLPNVVSRGQGHYLRCTGCSMFVLMRPVPVPVRGLGYEMDPSRKFFDKMPEES